MENYLLITLRPNQQLKFSYSTEFSSANSAYKKYEDDNNIAHFGSGWHPCECFYKFRNPKDDNSEYQLIDDEKLYYGHEKKEPYSFQFTVHSFGYKHFNSAYIIKRAFEILLEKINKTKDALLENNNKIFLKIVNNNLFYIYGEDYTLGNILISHVEKLQRTLGDSLKNYAGFKKTHPLDSEIILRIQNDPSKIKINEKEILIQAINEAEKTINDCQKKIDALI